MKITNYKFGSITIDSNQYKQDLIITKSKIISDWWRDKGHNLILSDFENLIDLKAINVVIIGTGAFGLMEVSSQVTDFFQQNNIDYYIQKTGKAVEKYNNTAEENKVAMLHLTC